MMPPIHRYAHEAMATHFQLLLEHEDTLLANAAAQAVFADIDRLETELSRFIAYSDISLLNQAPVGAATRVGAACLDCLAFGKMVWEQTGGAFDVSIGPLFRLLREQEATGRRISKAERATAVASLGYQHLSLDEENFTVTKHAPGMSLDLGAIGKGYALDQAAFLLRDDHGITNALLNAGDSTVLGIGRMGRQAGWPVTAGQGASVVLLEQALSGTGFQHQGAHIIDPRTARRVNLARNLRWAIAPTATLADALSTAFMVMNRKEIDALCARQPGVQVIFC